MLLNDALRVSALALLVIIIIMDDFPFYNKMKDPTTQLFLAVIIVLCFVFDTVFGFIMGLVLLVIYFEIYRKIKLLTKNNKISEKVQPQNEENNQCIRELDYISEELLFAAQNNVFDEANLKTEVKGIDRGLNNEPVYGAQGQDCNKFKIMAYNKDEIDLNWK